ncbi:MAG: class I SAM-dependent rRNA methyltransferase [Deltaproteobacteria bacterium]|nr:class I SAM-dependent rRNA methyltransferase [Deltaproteobacteria bacterium]
MKIVVIKQGREKSIERLHPWVFSGAIAKVSGNVSSGDIIQLQNTTGRFLGYGHYSEHSQIAVRVWSFQESVPLDVSLLKNRLREAINFRQQSINTELTNCYRIANSEADQLPGLIVDRYDNFLVCQFLTAGVDSWRQEIVNALCELLNPRGIYNRSDADVREKEGLNLESGVLFGEMPPERVPVLENGHTFLVDVQKGHKTSCYLDQRDNRNLLGQYARGKEILNCFSYSGGYCVYALKNGADKVINVEASAITLDLLKENMSANNIAEDKYETICADVFELLRKYRDKNRKFDIIILDPPKFVESKNALMSGARGYKDINLLAFKLLKPGGLFFTFSCSGHVNSALFQKIVADAAVDAKRSTKIIKRLEQSICHNTSLNFPEGDYLKGLLISVN